MCNVATPAVQLHPAPAHFTRHAPDPSTYLSADALMAALHSLCETHYPSVHAKLVAAAAAERFEDDHDYWLYTILATNYYPENLDRVAEWMKWACKRDPSVKYMRIQVDGYDPPELKLGGPSFRLAIECWSPTSAANAGTLSLMSMDKRRGS